MSDLIAEILRQPEDVQKMLWLSLLPHVILLSGPLIRLCLQPARGIDLFDPVFMASGSAMIGTTIRTFFIFLDADPDFMVFVMGPFEARDILDKGLLAINVTLLLWVIFYYIGKHTGTHKIEISYDVKKYLSVTKYFVFGSFALTMLYLYQIEYFRSLSTFGWSGKRFFSVDSDITTQTAYAYLKLGQDFSATAAILFACYYFGYARTRKNLFILLGIVLVACIIPLIASIRGEVAYLVLSIIIVRHYLHKRVSIPLLIVFLACSFVFFAFMQSLRMESFQRREYGADYQAENSVSTIQAVVYSSHFTDVTKTAVIMANVPAVHDYMYGYSYALTLLAPIPRVLWPEKPPVRIGRVTSTLYYDRDLEGGIPPGLTGEAYMNFGWPGIVFNVSVFGFLCGYAYRRQVLSKREDMFKYGLYAILWITMLDVFSNDVTGDIMRFMRYLLPYLLITRLARTTVRSPLAAGAPVAA